MNDRFLFVVAPYGAALVFVTVTIARFVLRSRLSDRAGVGVTHRDRGRLVSTWRGAIAVIALGHLFAFAFPGLVLLWNRQPVRLLLLEGLGLAAGSVALVAFVTVLGRRARMPVADHQRRLLDVVAGTLILIELISGVAMAALYRWGSSWSEVTVVPYGYSLLRLEPSPELVAHLPVLVRLHVFCGVALLAVAPFTRLARFITMPAAWLSDWMVARGSGLVGPAWCALEEWGTKRVEPLRAMVLRDDGEEN